MPSNEISLYHSVAGTATKVAPGLVDGPEWRDAHVSNGKGSQLSTTFTMYADEGYWRGSLIILEGGVVEDFSGTGAGISDSGDVGEQHPGIAQMTVGNTATGRVSMRGSPVTFGAGTAEFMVIISIDTLSDGTNTYTIRLGWCDSSLDDGVDGVFFRYTHSVNSGKWQAVARAASSETTADTGVTATDIGGVVNASASDMHTFQIVVDVTAGEAEFFIDGVSVAVIDTNIPTDPTRHMPVQVVASAGGDSAGRTVYYDAYAYTYIGISR